METIGARIRRLRVDQKISRQDLARYAGIKVSTLSDLELGESKSTTRLHRIAEKLGVSARYLETGRDDAGVSDAPARYGTAPRTAQGDVAVALAAIAKALAEKLPAAGEALEAELGKHEGEYFDILRMVVQGELAKHRLLTAPGSGPRK